METAQSHASVRSLSALASLYQANRPTTILTLGDIYVERLWRNVKYEDIYLQGYETMTELVLGLTRYFAYYNQQRPHQSLAYKTPKEVYQIGLHGGAYIPDKFSHTETADNPKTAQSCLIAVNE